MSTFTEIAGDVRGFAFSGCYVRRRDIIGFAVQKWTVDDTLVPRDTTILFYYPDDPKADQWAESEVDDVTGINGAACFMPDERWVFVQEPGEVYVVGQGDDDYEKPIDPRERHLFLAVRCIAGSHAYAVGIGREVYKRTAANKWERLTDKSLSKLPKAMGAAGFRDIGGFTEEDLYACGGQGDLWHFNGKKWNREDVPVNSNLQKICCASNGLVYITTNRNELIIGKSGQWRVAPQDIGNVILQEIVEFGSRVLVSTEKAIFQVSGDKLVDAKLGLPSMDLYSHMAAADGILVVAGASDAYMYDGQSWKRICKLP